MQTVSVINYKGGVGKTSLTANLAAELAFRGKKVLLIDLDAQASLTFSLIRPDDWNQNYSSAKTVKTWFDAFDANNPISLASIIQSPPKINAIVNKNGGQVDAI